MLMLLHHALKIQDNPNIIFADHDYDRFNKKQEILNFDHDDPPINDTALLTTSTKPSNDPLYTIVKPTFSEVIPINTPY